MGSGQLRFKFQEEKQYSARARKHHALSSGNSSETISDTSSSSPSQSPPQTVFAVSKPAKSKQNGILNFQVMAPETPQALPSSDVSSLAGNFIATIKRSTDLRYNLWWSFGLWLEDVPRRLGTNEALDRAVDALTTAHSNFSCGRPPSVEALSKNSSALRTLSVYLDDRDHAQSSSTLSAVMILLMCQLFLGPSKRKYSGHAEGAAAILKARKDFGPRDAFEAKLFLSLRGSVVSYLFLFLPSLLSPLLFHDSSYPSHGASQTNITIVIRGYIQRQNKPHPRRMGQSRQKRLRQLNTRRSNANRPIQSPPPNASWS